MLKPNKFDFETNEPICITGNEWCQV